ncbi:MAG: D-alanine--D-alanine ligase [Opitutaceae bacterium]|nr:D-alanine--D-alanine ligase [Opitutaceae bacterium]
MNSASSAHDPIIAVFRGGVSPEREVSLGSGKAALESLRRVHARVEDYVIEDRAVPAAVDARTHVVFSTLHGVFGEDGGMQALLESKGIHYAGCDARSSALCFDKQRTKQAAAAAGVPVARGVLASRADAVRAAAIVADLGADLVVKPNCQGSSVGLAFVRDAAGLAAALASAGDDGCIVEQRIAGTEVTVGVLDGEAMAVVEIVPASGTFDYTSKYTKGLTEYFAPARLDATLTALLQRHAAAAFAACQCRDYARIDFMIGSGARPVMLEINTLPGLKETSLLPMSARVVGLDFDALLARMTRPAIDRFRAVSCSTGTSQPAATRP